MRDRFVAPAASLAVALVACSGHGGANGSESIASSDTAVSVAVAQTIAADTDVVLCQWVALPSDPVFLTGISSKFSGAFHHLYVFETDLTELPPNPSTPTDCYSGSPYPMKDARSAIYGAELTAGSFTMPSGVGLPMKPGAVLLVQAHYLNATASPIDVQGSLSIEYSLTDPGVHAGTYFFYDPFIDVGIQRLGSAGMRCAVPADVTILSTMAQAYERANGFLAFADSPGAIASDPFYQGYGWNDALPVASPIPLAAGSHVRFACSYDNASGTTEFLQGTDPSTSEQCILEGLFYPDNGNGFSDCADSDQFGTGSASCAMTRSCVDACPAESAPPSNLGLTGGEPAMDDCWQRCIAASAQNAAGPLFALRACIASSCVQVCGSQDSSSPSPDCGACIEANCHEQNEACEGPPPRVTRSDAGIASLAFAGSL